MGQNEKMTLAGFEEACEAVAKVTLDTSLIYSDYFSEMLDEEEFESLF